MNEVLCPTPEEEKNTMVYVVNLFKFPLKTNQSKATTKSVIIKPPSCSALSSILLSTTDIISLTSTDRIENLNMLLMVLMPGRWSRTSVPLPRL